MSIYGYFLTYTDYSESLFGTTRKDYGFVAAASRAEALATIEKRYETESIFANEIGISVINDDDENPAVLDQFQINFFRDAMRQNDYEVEGN